MLATNIDYAPLYPEVTQTSEDASLLSLVSRVKTVKQQHMEAMKQDTCKRFSPNLILADLTTMVYVLLQGVTTFVTESAVLAGFTLGFGVIAGVFTIGAAYETAKQAWQAGKNGDKPKAFRLSCDVIGLLGIGVIMILTPLAPTIPALAGFATFIAAFPWVLPAIFFAITIPLIWEIGVLIIAKMYLKQDTAAELKLEDLSAKLTQDIVNWDEVFGVNTIFRPEMSAEEVITTMETLQAGMGVTAALETFKLYEYLLQKDKEGALAQIKELQAKISEWNQKQHVRLLEQILFVIAFIVSMVALGRSPVLLNAIDNFFMAGANAIPLYMDIFWPFERNTILVVPIVEVDELITEKV